MIYLHPKALQVLKTKKLVVDNKVPDLQSVRRSIIERLFSFPWRPLDRYKLVYCPTAYILQDGTIVISPKTKELIDKLY